jgi:hypothetical protein
VKAVIVDTYYPDFVRTLNRSGSYAERLQQTLDVFFGTHSAYSRHLANLGWETIDIIANDEQLQKVWAAENQLNGASLEAIALAQIMQFKPDVVFFQDLSFFSAATLEFLRKRYLLAGQCSCPMPRRENVEKFHVLFTSFPHYIDPFTQLGVRAEFLPLAFDPLVIESLPIPVMRTSAVSIVGGYGRHWNVDELYTKLAEETPIEFYGYGYENAPEPVRRRYRGQAWGVDMYRVCLSSYIVFNRHGGVAQGFSNNLRMFEATGCGALLMTEYSPNLSDYFTDAECVSYVNADDAVSRIRYLLAHPAELRKIAAAGQQRTVTEHTYFQRMPKVSEVLKECLSLREA